MKKQFLNWICVILLIAAGCSQEPFVDEQVTDGSPTFITLTARMPDEGLQTRISLERKKLDSKLKWEAGDQLQLCLQYEGNTVKQTSTVTDISPDGKTAKFPITLPPDSYTTFDLYGVYGGGGLDDTDPTKAILPTSAASISGSLETLKANKTVMLTFGQTGIERANPSFSVDLNHLGSLFCIQLRNTDVTSWDNIKKVQLTASSTIYAHNNTGSATYDLTTGDFFGTTSENTLTFELPEATNLAVGGLLELWGWYPPVANENWPAMTLKVINASDVVMKESVSSKPARTTPTPAGKVFYFPATYDGTNLEFTTTSPPPITDIDGNVYRTVVIGNQEWMAENLRTTRYNDGTPIQTVSTDANWAALSSGAYAVYPIEGLTEAEVLDAYGTLYNWYAVETGKLCPGGWHVPTDAEWTALTTYLGENAGGKLKSTRTDPDAHPRWNSPNTGATDEYGFSALPGGYRNRWGTFLQVGNYGYGWSSSGYDETLAWFRLMFNDNGNVNRNYGNKKSGFSVRCLRD